VQQAFIDRDFSAAFVTDLSALATLFADAIGRFREGRRGGDPDGGNERVGSRNGHLW
jgi:hypothetical protein